MLEKMLLRMIWIGPLLVPISKQVFERFKLADPSSGPDFDVLTLHDALSELATLDPRQAAIVELRYFGGLTEEEVATVMTLSPATIRREIAAAKFWLGRRMKGQR